MSEVSTSEPGLIGRPSTPLVRLGAWLFKRRTWLPLPLALALLGIPTAPVSPGFLVFGAALIAVGELLRLWSVRHIGVVSRTRSHRIGPLVSSGPFEYVRNPLYVGNVLLWVGFALSAGAFWLLPVILLALGVGYHAIVRWEESVLEAELGERYRAYAGRVPRWIPSLGGAERRTADRQLPYQFSWRETFFSERGTLIAIAVACVLLWVKLRLMARS